MDLKLTKDIETGLQFYRDTPGAVLIDVRDRDEYARGHILGSVNVPLISLIDDIYDAVPNAASPVFLYCTSGNRSFQAATLLREMGFDNAASIGGIADYKGTLEKK